MPNSDEDYRTETRGGYSDVPMVVMVNRNSASASEIVSGAMQDHDRALVVGETTFGKALVQGVYRISNGAGLALTTGRYFTPSGRMIQRPWDGAFDEYLTYSLPRPGSRTATHAPSQLKYTDGGRKVYSGGGIEPDHFIAGPGRRVQSVAVLAHAPGPRRVRRALPSGSPRKATSGRRRGRRPLHKVAPRLDGDRRDGGGVPASSWPPSACASTRRPSRADVAFIKAMIRFEVDVDLFGIEEARRNLSKVDPQVQAALGYFDEAKQLLMPDEAAVARWPPNI